MMALARRQQGEGQAQHDQLARLGSEHQGQQQHRGNHQIEGLAARRTADRRRPFDQIWMQ